MVIFDDIKWVNRKVYTDFRVQFVNEMAVVTAECIKDGNRYIIKEVDVRDFWI